MLLSHMHQYRKTIYRTISGHGVGVHSGLSSSITLFPAPCGTGIAFRQKGCDAVYPVHARHIEVTDFCTVLRFSHDFCVQTVEHLLAACFGLGVTDIIIETSSGELPFFDGSALHFVHLLQNAGIKELNEENEYIVLREAVCIEHENSKIELIPGLPSIHVTVPLSASVKEEATFSMLQNNFYRDIASARTFSKLSSLEFMRSHGMIKGGSLDCAIVLREDGTAINSEGFRLSNECAKHKILDLIGDLMILGAPCIASINSVAPGHSRTLQAVQRIAKDAALSCRMRYSEVQQYLEDCVSQVALRYAF